MKEKKYIENFVNSLVTVESVKLNLKEVKKHIKSYEEFGKDIYATGKFTLEELKYYRKKLNVRLKEIKEEDKKYLDRVNKTIVCY